MVKAADALGEVAAELGDFPDLKEAVINARKIVQKAFYDAKLDDEMKFGI